MYSCDGVGVNPPLTFSDTPKEAKSLALIVDDPDAPIGTYVHWVVFNIPPTVAKVGEGKGIPGSLLGKNSSGSMSYTPACPPNGTHRYFFKLFALDSELPVSSGLSKEDLERAIQGHILASAELVGLYKRK